MSELTHRQRSAIEHLVSMHERYPECGAFSSIHLGTHNAQLLRRIVDSGLVIVTKGGRGSRQWFHATGLSLILFSKAQLKGEVR